MGNFPTIDKSKLFTESPDGLAISTEASHWLEEVVGILNYLLKYMPTRSRQNRDNLARLILAINHEQSGCKEHDKCRADLDALLSKDKPVEG